MATASPVAIAGADGHVGRWLVGRLGELGVEARAIPRDGDPAPAISGCQAVVHLAGTLTPEKPNTFELANVETVRRTVEGVQTAGGVQRLEELGRQPRVLADLRLGHPLGAEVVDPGPAVLGKQVELAVAREVAGQPEAEAQVVRPP